ncbi:uncharacterized protein LOC144452931 [Glandiceps talaboti]
MASGIDLRKFFFDIGNDIGDKDFDALKFIVGGEIDKQTLETLKNARELFSTMETRGLISFGDFTYLKKSLKEIGQISVVQKVEDFEKQIKPETEKTRGHTDASHGRTDSPVKPAAGSTSSTDSKTNYPISEWQEQLRDKYDSFQINPLPWWDGTKAKLLEDIYTDLELQTEDGNPFARDEIFTTCDERKKTRRRILIEGDPGYGKSTFCKQLAYEWANGKGECSKQFELLFLLELRKLREYHKDHPESSDLVDVICHFLFEDEIDRKSLKDFIDNHKSKVCFIFDGLDEVFVNNLPTYFKEIIELRKMVKSVVIVTSRKIREENPNQQYDTQLSVKGFTEERAKKLICKHIKEFKSPEMSPDEFFTQLNDSSNRENLIKLMESPLNTLLLWYIWLEQKGKFPSTITELYFEIVKSIYRRCSKGKKIDNLSDMLENEDLVSIGEKAYRMLMKGESKISLSDTLSNLGFFTTEKSFMITKVEFTHLTFLEFFAAVYVSSSPSLIRTLGQTYTKTQTLLFVAGLLKDNVCRMFEVMEPSQTHPLLPIQCLLESGCETDDDTLRYCACIMPEFLRISIDEENTDYDRQLLETTATVLKCPNVNTTTVKLVISTFDDREIELAERITLAVEDNKNIEKVLIIKYDFKLNDRCKDLIDSLMMFKFGQIEFRDKSDYTGSAEDYGYKVGEVLKALSLISGDIIDISLNDNSLSFIKLICQALRGYESKGSLRLKFHEYHENTHQTSNIIGLTIKAKLGRVTYNLALETLKFRVIDFYRIVRGRQSSEEDNIEVNIVVNYNSGSLPDIKEIKEEIFKNLDSSIIIKLEINDINKDSNQGLCPRIISIIDSLASVNIVDFTYNNFPVVSDNFTDSVLSKLKVHHSLKKITIHLRESTVWAFVEGVSECLNKRQKLTGDFKRLGMSEKHLAKTTFEVHRCDTDSEFKMHLSSEISTNVGFRGQQDINEWKSLTCDVNLTFNDPTNVTKSIDSELFNRTINKIIQIPKLTRVKINDLHIKGDNQDYAAWKALFSKSSLKDVYVKFSKKLTNKSEIIAGVCDADKDRNSQLDIKIDCYKDKTVIDMRPLRTPFVPEVVTTICNVSEYYFRGKNIYLSITQVNFGYDLWK